MSRRGFLAAAMSLIIPGLGQMYAGKGERGAAILLAVVVVGNLNTIFLAIYAANGSAPLTGWVSVLPRILHDLFAFYGIVFLAWQVVDAYRQAKTAHR